MLRKMTAQSGLRTQVQDETGERTGDREPRGYICVFDFCQK